VFAVVDDVKLIIPAVLIQGIVLAK